MWFIRPRYSCKVPSTHLCSMKQSEAALQLWHNRLGHVSMKRISALFKHHVDYGLPPLRGSQDVTCEDCSKCKSTRTRIPRKTNRDPCLLDIIVTDVVGPFTVCVTGEKLVVKFCDVATSYLEVCLIKHKSEVHQCLDDREKMGTRNWHKSQDGPLRPWRRIHRGKSRWAVKK